MTQISETPWENAAGSEVRADAPFRGVRTNAVESLFSMTPRAACGRGVFISVTPSPIVPIVPLIPP